MKCLLKNKFEMNSALTKCFSLDFMKIVTTCWKIGKFLKSFDNRRFNRSVIYEVICLYISVFEQVNLKD